MNVAAVVVSKVTRPLELVNVPPVNDQLPATVKALLVLAEGAVKVPLEITTAPLASMVELVAVQVPPLTVVVLPTVTALELVDVSSAPKVTVRAPATTNAPLVWKTSLVALASLMVKL